MLAVSILECVLVFGYLIIQLKSFQDDPIFFHEGEYHVRCDDAWAFWQDCIDRKVCFTFTMSSTVGGRIYLFLWLFN